jgi:predicted DsbA family dithiol-disulfide isomerase
MEAALARFPQAADVELVWHAFELDPRAPRVYPEVGNVAMLAQKYRVTPTQAQQMIDRVTQTAAVDGLGYRLDIARAGNTFDGHRVAQLASERGLQGAVMERLMKAYFSEGQAIGAPETLATLAAEVGLDRAEVAAMLATDRCAAEVRADEALAQSLGITGVPFFVIDQRLAVSGAQSADLLLSALQRGWREHAGAA